MAGANPTPPGSGPQLCGIGCNINFQTGRGPGPLVVKKVIPGGPAALSGEIGIHDVLLRVDGVDVTNETTDDLQRRIVGPEGTTIDIMLQKRVFRHGHWEHVESSVTLLRQPLVHMSQQLTEHDVGLGIDLARTDQGYMGVRRLQQGGAAALSGKLQVGDVLMVIDGHDVKSYRDVSSLCVGEPFSRVCMLVLNGGQTREVHMVRSVVLMGEYLITHSNYKRSLEHAPRAPPPPQRQQADAPAPVQQQRHRPLPPTPGPGAGGSGGATLGMPAMEVMGPDGVMAALENPQLGLAGVGSPAVSSPSNSSSLGGASSTDESLSWLSRSSGGSRDSIAPVVRQQFGEQTDAIRTVEGRQSTFTPGWPHVHSPCKKEKMALAGFVFTPSPEAPDKVTCAYCGVELAQWQGATDPWSEHHDASPGCSFWRKSSKSAERMSIKMFSGYGSPIHSMYLTAGLERVVF